jgi:serine/threonine protein kinase
VPLPGAGPPTSTLLERLRNALRDQYTVEREIGRGGMATVYLARDLRHSRAVALKLLDPDVGQAAGGERFAREIGIVAGLSHPHILPLLDSGTVTVEVRDRILALPYYVMPFVDGESLRQRLDREGRLPAAEAIRLAREVADALDHAHRNGIVHRDVKPENILLTGGHAVVADFGIAQAVGEAMGSRLTSTGLVIGSPHYLSPEQLQGERALDGRTDVYALGCVTYEMLAGTPPFAGGPFEAQVARRHDGGTGTGPGG